MFSPHLLLRPSSLFLALTLSAAGATDGPTPFDGGDFDKTASLQAAWSFEPDDLGDEFGAAVSTAGDVNGDGFSDVIVGAPGADDGQGRYPGRAVAFLGSAIGLDSAPAWTVQIGATGAEFGAAVAVAGDVNGDGYDDVIVGAPSGVRPGGGCGQPGGAAYVFHGGPSGLSTTHAWADGVCSEYFARFGSAVAPAGDVNGDGFDDILVGAVFRDGSYADEGFAYLYLGSASGLGASPAWTVSGGGTSIGLGTSVGTAGDVNADGFADIVVGGSGGLGQARVYLGGPSGPSTTPSMILWGDQNGAFFGAVVGTAGDANGDGYADVLATAPGYDYFGVDRGAVYVYPGGPSGVSPSPLWYEYGSDTNSRFGSTAATAGDVNGDALPDLIIGSTSWAAVGNSGGLVTLFMGYRGTGLLFHGWQLLASQAAESLGAGVGTAGDVNGDGFSDLLIGAPGFDGGQLLEGRAQVFHGAGDAPRTYPSWSNIGSQFDEGYAWSVASAGDVNGDGFSDMVLGRPLMDLPSYDNAGWIDVYFGGPEGISSPGWSYTGWATDQNLGVSVACAGDVNGDGYDDVLAGAHGINGGAGAALVWYGGPGGPSFEYDWIVEGTEPGSLFGSSVAGAGDVNGDGFCDVIVGSPNGGTSQEGRAHVYLGSAAGLASSPSWSIESNQAQAHLGSCVAGAGDVNGDGYSDVVVAAREWDTPGMFGIVDAGMVRVYHGGAPGLSTSPATTIEGGSTQLLGSSVASAGDVDGDGYADIVVGISNYNPVVSEGAAAVYLGGLGGVSTSAHWSQSSGQNFSGYGASVAGGGDVNGDGLSDIVIGAVFFDAGNQDEGIARVYAGPLTGSAATTPIAQLEGQGNFVNVGHVVAMAGDLNGDGFSDVASGAPGSTTNFFRDGKVIVAYGNGIFANGYSLPRRPRQLSATSSPLALLNSLGTERDFRLEMLARSAAGRDRVRLQWEVQPLGQPFGGPVSTGAFQLAAAPGVNGPGAAIPLQAQVAALSASTTYHWRVRTSAKSPYFPRSPWFSPQGNSPREMDLRTGEDAPNTPAGSNIVVQPMEQQSGEAPATVTFSQVSSPGTTTLSSSPSGPALPGNFLVGSSYYDLSTTATISGSIEVCIHYDPAELPASEEYVQLLHFDTDLEPDSWVEITTTRDLANDIVCGQVSHLSPFVVTIRTSSTSVAPTPDLPVAFALLDATPNPFNPRTEIRYAVPGPGGDVTLTVYDLAGRLVRTLLSGRQTPGIHEIVWDGRSSSGARVASGVYLLHMIAPDYRGSQKVLLLK